MTRTYFTLCIAATVVAIILSAAVFSNLPPRVPTHWNIRGEVDGYGSPTFAAFFVPAIMVGMLLLFAVLPWLSPKQFEVDAFRSTYGFISFLIMVFLAYVHGLTLWAALGHKIDVPRALLAGMLLMFGLMGNVLGKVRRNFWVGIRTPWTLANDRVWNDTHRLAARLFVAAGLLGIPLIILPIPLEFVFIIVISLIMAAAIIPAAYSAVHYKKLQSQGQL
jgi:uncharacterized membrane protein